MARPTIKPLTTTMHTAWVSASLTASVGIAAFLHFAGYSLADASLGQFLIVVGAFALLSFLLRLFFQQADTPEDLVRNFRFRRRR